MSKGWGNGTVDKALALWSPLLSLTGHPDEGHLRGRVYFGSQFQRDRVGKAGQLVGKARWQEREAAGSTLHTPQEANGEEKVGLAINPRPTLRDVLPPARLHSIYHLLKQCCPLRAMCSKMAGAPLGMFQVETGTL